MPYGPVRILMGPRTQKAAASACEKLATSSKARGGDIALTMITSASRDATEQQLRTHPETASAITRETRREATAFVVAELGH
jgi:hypothetical protein